MIGKIIGALLALFVIACFVIAVIVGLAFIVGAERIEVIEPAPETKSLHLD